MKERTRSPRLPKLKSVGHKGAGSLVPGNTRESFEAALALGIDMIEFDVLRLADGRLVLAHDAADAATRTPLALEEGLDLFAGESYAAVELDVDLKRPGYERDVVEALRGRGMIGRSLVSSTYRESLDLVGELEPELRRGWSLPRAERDYTTTALFKLPARGFLLAMRAWLPGAAARALAERRCEAVMAHHGLVGPRLVAAVHAEGGLLYAWTVDDQDRIETLAALGLDGVITNRPELLRSSPPAAAG